MLEPISNTRISRFFMDSLNCQPKATKVALGMLVIGIVALGGYSAVSYMAKKNCKVQDSEAVSPPKSNDVLFSIFSKLTTVKDLGSCYRVCKNWKAVIDERDDLWKPIALRNALGKNLWEESVREDVGDLPCYRIEGKPVPWKKVYAMHKTPSLFASQRRLEWFDRLVGFKGTVEELEFDFLVPQSIGGAPTTIRRVLEVFAQARLPIQCRFIDPDFLAKYGDIPILESYWARYTITIVDGTLEKDPEVRVQIIHQKGKGLYRLPCVIEHMIFTFLSHQAGKENGYVAVNNPHWGYDETHTQTIETHSQTIATVDGHGQERPIYAGGFASKVFQVPDGLEVCHNASDNCGAGALRAFI